MIFGINQDWRVLRIVHSSRTPGLKNHLSQFLFVIPLLGHGVHATWGCGCSGGYSAICVLADQACSSESSLFFSF